MPGPAILVLAVIANIADLYVYRCAVFVSPRLPHPFESDNNRVKCESRQTCAQISHHHRSCQPGNYIHPGSQQLANLSVQK